MLNSMSKLCGSETCLSTVQACSNGRIETMKCCQIIHGLSEFIIIVVIVTFFDYININMAIKIPIFR